MADLLAMGISMAGSIAGAKAGQALFGGKPAPPGGGIPGLTSSVGSGKDGTKGQATQVDPTKSLEYFKQAAAAQSAGFDTGLQYYGEELKKSVAAINAGYTRANSALSPLSVTSNQALNEQMRMMGLDPIQTTASYGASLRAAASSIGALQGDATFSYVNKLANQLDAAGALKNPEDRIKARETILANIGTADSVLLSPLQKQLTSVQSTLPEYVPLTKDEREAFRQRGMNTVKFNKAANAGEAAHRAEYAKKVAENIDQQKKVLTEKIGQTTGYIDELKNFGDQFSSAYGDVYDRGYTGSEITSKVTQTPCYQFQYEQGVKALERTAAAKGMLQSANTMGAIQEFGQNQAMSYYNNYLSQLSGAVAQGANATGQIAANQVGQGNALSTLAQQYGAARMDTARQNATYLASTLMNAGTLYNQTSMFNAQQQNTAIQNQLNRDQQNQQAAQQNKLGYLQANNQASYQQGMLNLAQQQFDASQAANRQGAQGYYYGSAY